MRHKTFHASATRIADLPSHGDAPATIMIVCRLEPMDAQPLYDNLLMIGDAAYRRKGFGTEATAALIDRMFASRSIEKITSKIPPPTSGRKSKAPEIPSDGMVFLAVFSSNW